MDSEGWLGRVEYLALLAMLKTMQKDEKNKVAVS